MPDGKIREYYWRIRSFIAEHSEYLHPEYSVFSFPDEDDVENRAVINTVLTFRDGSNLHIRSSFDDRAEIREYDYAYVYYDRRGKRIFQYDDAPHHSNISTHPHHLHLGEKRKRGKERITASDLPRIDFISVIQKIIERFE